jgi:hypothetical protein
MAGIHLADRGWLLKGEGPAVWNAPSFTDARLN